ncbi:hypothetical protein K8I85_06630 [bacterium]|nr:hypothetical protein [bacterium]
MLGRDLFLVALLSFPSVALARTWHILPDGTGDAPTIQAGVDSAAVGDTLLLACGTFFEHDIEMKSEIAIVGGTPGCVIIDAEGLGRVFSADSASGISYSGLDIQNGNSGVWVDSGGGLYLNEGDAVIESCVFRNNTGSTGGAILVDDATLTISDSYFVGNSGQNGGVIRSLSTHLFLTRCTFDGNEAWGTGGVLTTEATNFVTIEQCSFRDNIAQYSGAIHASFWGTMSVRNSLFVGNQAAINGGAIYSQAWAEVVVDGCTFWGNGAPNGATFFTMGGTIEAASSILAGSTMGEAVHCEEEWTVSIACCDIFGNQGGDWTGCIADQFGINGNFSADPLFCDPDNGDFTIQSISPCAPPGVTGCGLIGALPVGCGPVAVEAMSWGKVKGAYR